MLHDQEIREPLFDYLETEYGKIRIIEEKQMGKSRADLIMVTEDALYGIEIKSDADSYSRLSSQVKDYDRYCDYNLIVVGSRHGLHAHEHVPSHWGIITVEEMSNGEKSLDFYKLRSALPNPKAKLACKLELLWRTELAALQECFGFPKYKEKSKDFVIQKICEKVPNKVSPEELHREISRLLFERDYTTINEEIREYKKSEYRKRLEAETDPLRQLEIMVEAAGKGIHTADHYQAEAKYRHRTGRRK